MPETVTFQDQVCTIEKSITRRERMVLAGAGGAFICASALATLLFSKSTVVLGSSGFVALTGVGAAVAAACALEVEIRIDTRHDCIAQSYRVPWSSQVFTRVTVLRAAHSLGVDRIADGECGDRFFAVLRMAKGKRIKLWEVMAQGESASNILRFVRIDARLRQLQDLTGLRREDRI